MVIENAYNVKERDLKSMSIDIELIYPQNYIYGRNIEEESETLEFHLFEESLITTKGAINPIVVREDGTGKYELFSGNMRLKAYENIFQSGNEQFSQIPASVYPVGTSTLELLLKTIHENSFRKDLKKVISIEAKISFIPIFLELEGSENNGNDANLGLGHDILKKYMRYIRSKRKDDRYLKKIQEMTGDINVIPKLMNFFQIIGTTPEKFYLSARVYFEVSRDILIIFHYGKICDRHALAIDKMKSLEDKNNIVSRLHNYEDIAYGELEKYIRDSNSQFSPIKKSNKLIQKVEHFLTQLRSDKGATRTAQENDEINMHFEKIENIINK